MRCDTCRWWEFGQEARHAPDGGTTATQGACLRFGRGVAEMDDTRGAVVDTDGWESARAYIAPNGTRSLFITAGDFGCVQHEVRMH